MSEIIKRETIFAVAALLLFAGVVWLFYRIMAPFVAVVIIVPLVLLSFALVGEVAGLYARVESAVTAQGAGWTDLRQHPLVQSLTRHLEGVVDLSQLDVNKAALGALGKVSTFVVSHTTSLLANIGRENLRFLLVLLTMYYLFKDGDGLLAMIRESIPLPPVRSGQILAHITDVVRATIYG